MHAAMHLAFALEGCWAPYAKWFGTAFDRLPVARRVGPPLLRAVSAEDRQERQEAVAEALDVLLDRQGGGPARATAPFWDRPFLRVDEAVVPALLDGVEDRALLDPSLRAGAAEQRTDVVPLLVDPAARRALIRVR